MSKGYADYLCALAREVDREFQRDADGVEAPLFKKAFEEWLQTQNLSEDSQENYKRWLRKADEWICTTESDFWTLLKRAWDVGDFRTARTLCDNYEKELKTGKSQAEELGKEEWGESAKEIGNWISAFHKYEEFFEAQIEKASNSKQTRNAMIESARASAGDLFMEASFISWGSTKGKAEGTMKSYASYIKHVNRDLFCKTGYDILQKYLPVYVKTGNEAKINEMFASMDRILSKRIDNIDETDMPLSALTNGRAAIRSYADFIRTPMTS